MIQRGPVRVPTPRFKIVIKEWRHVLGQPRTPGKTVTAFKLTKYLNSFKHNSDYKKKKNS